MSTQRGKNAADDNAGTKAAATGPACPICGKPRVAEYRPFCCKRCADVDLGRWLNGSYAIPVTEDDDEDGEDGGTPEDGPARSGGDGAY